MFGRTDGNRNHLYIRIFQERRSVGIACAMITFHKILNSGFVNVACGDNLKTIRILVYLRTVHVVSGSSDSPQSDFDWIHLSVPYVIQKFTGIIYPRFQKCKAGISVFYSCSGTKSRSMTHILRHFP